ncbi:hypothetical protein R1flu_023253 [Riccia fluitans]|uniref:Uncharacterized protein n=1 Tax=Riccia fluitans TaxID=41844 RepID=A0ABD1XUJ4_9MARC
MHARGIEAEFQQLKNKWESLHGDWKSIRDFMAKAGRGNYFEMSKEERKSKKLPPKFEKELFDLMGFFLKKRPSINPPCMAESFECQPEAPSKPVPPTEYIPNDNAPPNDNASPTEAHAPLNQEATSKFNSGIWKRKKQKTGNRDCGTEAFAGVSEKMVSVEERKLEFLVRSEDRKLDIAKEQLNVLWEHS